VIRRIAPGPRMSRAVVHDGTAQGTVYVSGHVSAVEGGVAAQTRDILAAIDDVLARAHTNKSHLLLVQIWLADIGTFDEMNAVWEAWIDPRNPPARATVEARLAGDEYLVEIAAIAALP
jgi:enamine deaminase RidA (YjgF/YER057c/UK114 family)